jgi:VanZ family protein
MASFSIVYRDYALHTTAGGRARWQDWLRTWLPVLACLMVFAVESTSCFGADRTDAPLRRVAEALFGYDICVHWELIHYLIRKTGHFAGYGLFSLLCFRAFWRSFQVAASRMPRQLRAHGLAILATFLVAGADEFHQSFVPNRFGIFSDVLLDTYGAVAVCFVLFLAMQAAEQRRAVRRPDPACAEAVSLG